MEIVIQILQLLLSLSLLIVLHELGHFIPAKLFKTRVEKFYLFFPPWFSLFKKKIGETTYGIGWLPLGGFVKISGMVDESMDKEQMKQEPQPWEFRSKPAWQRLIIMLGGIFVNTLLAVIIYSGVLFVWGQTVIPTKSLKDGIAIVNQDLSDTLGIKTGDKIIAVDGENVEEESVEIALAMMSQGSEVTVNRNGENIHVVYPAGHTGLISEARNQGRVFEIRRPFELGEVSDSMPAKAAGIKKGDIVKAVDGNEIVYQDELITALGEKKGETVVLTILRDSVNTLELNCGVTEEGKIGVQILGISNEQIKAEGYYQMKHIDYSFTEAVPAGFKEAGNKLGLYVAGFMKLLDFRSEAYKAAGGFKAFGSMFSTEWNWELFWRNTAFISIILAFMNLLPIPALDGGHAMFLSYELLTGRKPNDKLMEYAQMAGMIFLLSLVLLANINDWI